MFLSHGEEGDAFTLSRDEKSDAFARIWVLLAVAAAPKPESYATTCISTACCLLQACLTPLLPDFVSNYNTFPIFIINPNLSGFFYLRLMSRDGRRLPCY